MTVPLPGSVPSGASDIPIPEKVWAEGGHLYYKFGSMRVEQPDKDLLFGSFLPQVAQTGPADFDQAVLRFARTWGPLYLCACGLPETHQKSFTSPHCSPPSVIAGRVGGIPAKPGEHGRRCHRQPEWDWKEPISGWKLFGDQIIAALGAAKMLIHPGSPRRLNPKDRDTLEKGWEILRPAVPNAWILRGSLGSSAREGKISAINAERFALLHALTEWMEMAEIRPVIEWQPETSAAQIRLGGGPYVAGSLYAAILLQAVFAAVRSSGIAFCDGCGRLFSVTRPVAAGRRRYCLVCVERGLPQRDAARDYRRRQRLNKALDERHYR